MAVSAAIQLSGGWPQRFSAEIRAIYDLSREQEGGGCFEQEAAELPPEHACVLGAQGARPQTVLWGDSHAYQFARPLEQAFRERGRAFRLYGYNQCPPVLGVEPMAEGHPTGCPDYNDEVLRRILRDPDIRTVVLAARHSLPLIGHYGNVEPETPVQVRFRPLPGLPDRPREAAYLARLGAPCAP